ncbi:MAG: NUDIX hydrolase [Marinicaulis sp.]|nr:NUDIX hydrolase [Marinicaulis sp.]NNE40380.1 NUDIX hydrolase [Marinicaulis sp.]NNL88521.1 NUDIX hydrolase [Marinicaulis sp.]
MSEETKNGPWVVRSSRLTFENPWIRVTDHDVLHPDGSDGEYGVVSFKNIAIGVLPITERGETWLVGQHRFPSEKYSWELPEGGGLVDDSPLESAKRELREETGVSAENWIELTRFDVSNSVTDERAICFLAYGLHHGQSAPEPSELLDVKKVPLKDVYHNVMTGEISDSLTIMMVLMASAKALRGELPAPISSIIIEATKA